MNINIYANYDKIPNIINQDMNKQNKNSFQDLQSGLTILVLIPRP